MKSPMNNKNIYLNIWNILLKIPMIILFWTFFDQTSSVINQIIESQGTAYVHCQAGISRSPAIVMAYLIWKGSSFEEAYQCVKQARPIARPNESFIRQLKQYANLKNPV